MRWLVTLTALTLPAFAHEAPTGWTYPSYCCAGIDCRPVPSTSILEWPRSYVIKQTGEIIAQGDRRLFSSPDGDYHWCSVEGKADTHTICLFVPPRSF